MTHGQVGVPSWCEWRILVSLTALALFAVACVLPAAYFDDGIMKPQPDAMWPDLSQKKMGSPSGYEALMMGWLPPYTLPWVANVFLLVGLIALVAGKYNTAGVLGSLGTMFAFSAWLTEIPRLLVGYYLWQISLLVLAAGGIWLAMSRDRILDQRATGTQMI